MIRRIIEIEEFMKRKQLFLLSCVLLLLVTLFVSCKKDTVVQVNLTMVANDGSADTVVQAEQGKPYTLPALTREGYEFGGWYTKADFSGTAVTTVTPDADTTVFAKWEKLYTVTLDPANGTLGTTTLKLKAGDPLAEKLAGLVPEKADSRFGMWLMYGEALPENAAMPAEDVTLVARYQVKFTVDIYLQNTALNGYEKSAEPIVGYEYAGTAYTSTENVKGFTEVAKSDSVTRLVLSDDASKNTFRHYFDRTAYSLTFVSNYPDGSENDRKTEKLYYGVETEIPFQSFEMEGYYLEGWSLSAGGKMVYSSHLMDGKLFNGEPCELETITAEGNITLYAVWSKGYTNLFGGDDIIYVSAGEAKTVYLNRGGVFFKGTLNGKTLLFLDASVDFPQGVLNSDGKTFLFLDPQRAEMSATLYEMGKGLNELVKIYLTQANGITYSVKETAESPTTEDSEGEFFFTEEGYMIATFKSGPLQGKTIIFTMGKVTINGESRSAFQIRNEEELALGKIAFFTVKNNAIVVNTDESGASVGDITLDGFGIATYYGTGGQTTTFYYTFDAEKQTITLRSTDGKNTYVLKLMTVNGVLGYMIYNETTDVTYELEDGSTLSTDGMRTATFVKKDGTKVSGFFTAKSSALGGTLLSFTDIESGKGYLFMITSKVVEVPVDPTQPDSETKKETVTTVEEKDTGYAEYYYKDAEGIYYAPLFVFENANRTAATVYGYSKDKQYHKIAAGTLTFDAETGRYTFTVTERFDLPEGVEVFTSPLDFSTVQSCVMMLDATATQYQIHFWFNYNNGVETVELAKNYNGEKESKLTLVGGLAIYQINGKTEIGTYKQSGELVTVTFSDRTLYFYLNEENASFEVYTTTATTYYEVDKSGKTLRTRYLVFDPRNNNEISFYIITGEGEEQVTVKYEGKLIYTGKNSLTGFPIYEFTSNEKKAGTEEPVLQFRFIERTISSGSFLFVYDEAYAGSFRSENTKNGVLTLDGFGFAGTFSDDEGNEIMGIYQKDGNNVTISNGTESYYFVLNGTTCKLRGEEFGKAFLVVDNHVFAGFFAEFDGIGNATLFRIESNGTESERVDIDPAATYTINGDVFTLVYHIGNEEHTLICRVGTYSVSGTAYNALKVIHDEVVYSYVNVEDWSVLRLNNDGSAIKYLMNGGVESGTYSLITETLLYYVNSSESEAFIYVYDKEAGTATPRTYTEKAYYTKDLDSLLFSKYGFAIFNDTRYYYTEEADGSITLYYLDESSADKNVYGYVEESFGKLEDTKEYHGKLYYKNDGFAISFVRNEATKDKYPVLVDSKEGTYLPSATLTFSPIGGETFSVTGYVMIGDEQYECTVVKELDENGTPSMYFRIGIYYFYITINYQGDGIGEDIKSTYEVTGLSKIRSMPSYTYLYYLYYIYSTMGPNYANGFTNQFGVISMHTEYDEAGKESASYVNATFGKSSNFMLSDGELITTLEKAPLKYLGSDGRSPYYQADFTGDDGYRYSLIFTYSPVAVFQTYGYNVYALLREETLKTTDGYDVTVTRVIASEARLTTGAYYSFGLAYNGEALQSDTVILNDGKLYYVVRTKDENGRITATDYYLLNLTEKSSGSIDSGEEDEEKPLPVYESATVTKITATTVYTADGKYYLDILPENRILILAEVTGSGENTKVTTILISECNYDEATGVYTLKDVDGKVYEVTVTAGTATVTEVSPAPEAA